MPFEFHTAACCLPCLCPAGPLPKRFGLWPSTLKDFFFTGNFGLTSLSDSLGSLTSLTRLVLGQSNGLRGAEFHCGVWPLQEMR